MNRWGKCALLAALLLACSDVEVAAPGDASLMRPNEAGGPLGEAGSQPTGRLSAKALRVSGRFFIDARGGVTVLRGVNVAGNSKVPPFVPFTDASMLDRLRSWGLNCIRLVLVWEAYEPIAGQYDETYLAQMVGLADAAWARGLHVIVDSHQDGYSRYAASGCGSGFPRWALSPKVTPAEPDNGAACANFGVKFALDQGISQSFHDFYANVGNVRDRYLTFLSRVARHFASRPGVIGYDLINEPFAIETSELGPLLQDAAAAVRKEDPEAILFVEGVAGTNSGNQTTLERPNLENFAYAPHFYDTAAVSSAAWGGVRSATDIGFGNMNRKATEWRVPLFVGEFGMLAGAVNAGPYMDLQYIRLDEFLASGTQWNYTPSWTLDRRDGWNREDFSIADDHGNRRPNFKIRPYARRIAGMPSKFTVKEPTWLDGTHTIELRWQHQSQAGETVLYAPKAEIFNGAEAHIVTEGTDLECAWDRTERLVTCRSQSGGPMMVRVAKNN